jgi:hypothetical protein
VVWDLSGYTNVTVELLDYRHSSWGVLGTWDYKLHIVDWDTYSEIAVVGPLQTTGNDIWEEGIDLGSLPETGLVGVFLEPMGNSPTDAYPCLDSDDVGPDGMSYYGQLPNYSTMGVSGIGDFLMDLWIMAEQVDGPVKAPKFVATYGNGNAKIASTAVPPAFVTPKQTVKNTDAILEGYNIYRGGGFIGYVAIPTSEYVDYDLNPGTYQYYVTAVYDEGESGPSNEISITIEGGTPPPPPTNLTATGVAAGVQLNWLAPQTGEWIQWDAGVNTGNGIGLTNGGTFSCASHWAPADLTPYDGYLLKKVSFFPNADPAATFVIKVWTGANGTTNVLTQNVASYTVDEWNEVELTTPVTISASTDLWFGYSVTHGAGTFPAGCDDGPAVQGKGDMISTGGAWVSMSAQYGLDYNWNIAGYVDLSDGVLTPMTPIVEEIAPINTGGTFVSATEMGQGGNQSVKFLPNGSKDITYNVYWSTTSGGTYIKLNTSPVAVTTYLHTTPVQGWNYYYVRSFLNGLESVNSNQASILYTSIEDIIYSQTQIYPNPATSVVNIKSEFDILSVRIYNQTGQVVANEPVSMRFYQFNTSQFNPGLYMFQVETAEGTITKRIIIE